jgi:hypothetical protein
MADPSINLRAFLSRSRRQSGKKGGNQGNPVTDSEIKSLDQPCGYSEGVTGVTGGLGKPASSRLPLGYLDDGHGGVTEKDQSFEYINPSGYPVTELPGKNDAGDTDRSKEPAISADEVRLAFEVAVDQFMFTRGVRRSVAEISAYASVRGFLLNDPRLIPLQWDTRRCWVCNEPGAPSRILAPFCTPVPDRLLWMHLEPCHAEHRRRQAAKVEALLARAFKSEHGSVRLQGFRPPEDGSLETTPAQAGNARSPAMPWADQFAVPPQRSAS